MKPKSKTQVEAQAQAQGSAVEPTVKVEAPSVVGPLGAYGDELARASDILDAKAREAGKALPDSVGVRNALFNSLTLFLRASGVGEGEKLDKETKAAWRKAHDEYRSAVRTEAAVMVTVRGQHAEVVKLGNARVSGLDENGVPRFRDQSATVRTALRPEERRAWIDSAVSRLERVKATLA